MTFRELYDREVAKPTPAQAFISKVMGLTCVTEGAVRTWLNGDRAPGALIQQVLAKSFKTTPAELFPAADEARGSKKQPRTQTPDTQEQ